LILFLARFPEFSWICPFICLVVWNKVLKRRCCFIIQGIEGIKIFFFSVFIVVCFLEKFVSNIIFNKTGFVEVDFVHKESILAFYM